MIKRKLSVPAIIFDPKNPPKPSSRPPQTLKQQISARVNWVQFQLGSAIGNVRTGFYQLTHDPQRFQLKDADLYKLYNLHDRAIRATTELDEVRKEIAEWNRNKTWVD